jgi:hypothetical protein
MDGGWRMVDGGWQMTVWSITTTRKKNKEEDEMCFVFIRMLLMGLEFVSVL